MSKPAPRTGELMPPAQAAQRITAGQRLWIAGDARVLRTLPKGQWVGGTIPYFQTPDGGVSERQQVFVCEAPALGGASQIRSYDITSLSELCLDTPAHGYTFLLIPAFSDVHSFYARNAAQFPQMFMQPVVGWVAGMHLTEASEVPAVVDGSTGRFDTERALAMHMALPEDYYTEVEILNPYEQGEGARIRFSEPGFSARTCLVDGHTVELAPWLQKNGIDLRLPLVADYCGAMVNVSFKGVDKSGRVDFYAPVFDDVEYRLARRRSADAPAAADTRAAAFSCNCILNHLHGGLAALQAPPSSGPLGFGEIAWMLLNQTQVRMYVESA
ncbi:MAG: DUF6976 family protein [Rhodoferax sp.]